MKMKQRIYNVYPFIFPPAFPDYNIPPTIYSLLNSIVNYNNEDKVAIKNLAEIGRVEIFDFEYPLSSRVNKRDFECMILNHFLMRRIGYDTLTAFKIALNVKLNEIMPIYNKLFDSLIGWDLFTDGERVTESGENTMANKTNSIGSSDRRYSDTPQNRIYDVRDGKYLTDYNYDTDSSNINSESNGTDSRTIVRTPANKMEIYKQFIENRKSIYTMIFEELDSLFYGLV